MLYLGLIIGAVLGYAIGRTIGYSKGKIESYDRFTRTMRDMARSVEEKVGRGPS